MTTQALAATLVATLVATLLAASVHER